MSDGKWVNYKNQRNLSKSISDSKKVLKTIMLFFPNKDLGTNSILLEKNNKIVPEEEK